MYCTCTCAFVADLLGLQCYALSFLLPPLETNITKFNSLESKYIYTYHTLYIHIYVFIMLLCQISYTYI